jgi:hypothetical protein
MKKITPFIFFLLSHFAFATTFYVNPDAAGNNTGTSWANAFTSLQGAINAANTGDILFVKSGRYCAEHSICDNQNLEYQHIQESGLCFQSRG